MLDDAVDRHASNTSVITSWHPVSRKTRNLDNVFDQTAARLPWLLIGMIGGLGNSVILGGFESSFATNPKMALFIPLIGGTGGNVGIQSSAIVVQGLANTPKGREYRTANPKRVCSLVNQCQHYQSGRVHLQFLHAGRPGDYGLRIFKPIRRRNVRQYIRHASSHDLR